jgi:DMSO/TMAO reductase YedYZ molybdopterin-dependent catalytic subunit
MLNAVTTTNVGLFCPIARAQLDASSPILQPMNLTIIGLNGTQVVLNSSDIANLPSSEGPGGIFGTANGSAIPIDNYTGIPLTTLCDMVGGINNTESVRVIGSDNYYQDFSFDEVINGNFTTFDPATGFIVLHNETLTPIIAYYKDGVNLTSDEGPLLLAIIGPEGLATTGHYWVKWVVEIEILNEVVPEFQTFPFTFFLLIIASTTMILLKKYSTMQPRHKGLSAGQKTSKVK